MPNITIIGKEGHNVLQQTTANEVKITENSVVVIKVQKEDVKSMVQNGDALVITLKNGETIVIDNFFNNENNKNADDNTVVFEDQNGNFFLPGKAGADGVVLDYNPLESIEPLLYHDGAAPVLPWLLAGAGIATIAAIAGSGGDHNDRDITPPTKPMIDPIEAGSKDPITGEGEPGGTVKVTYPDGTTATAPVGTDGKWTVPNPGLKDGEEVTAVVTDPSGNTSPPTTEKVEDTTPPIKPGIDPIEAGSKDPITGEGEPGGTVKVTYPDGTTATAPVGTDGKWTVPNPGLKDGDEVTAVVTDPSGNTSPPEKETVEDTTPPTKPGIDPIEAGSKDPITGEGEPGGTVKVTYPDGTTATAPVGTDGKWTVPNPGLKDGDEVTAVVTDPSGNTSPPEKETVEDTTPPTKPGIDPIEAGSKDPITGEGEPGGTVKVTYPDGTTATAPVGTDGKWTVPNPGLKDGDEVTAVVTDPSGNTSPPEKETVKDTIAPDAPDLNSIEAGLPGDRANDPITGKGEPGGKITVTYPDGTTATTTVDSNGKWIVTNPGLADGTIVIAIETDAAGNTSKPTEVTVKDTIPPPIPVIDPIEAGSKDPITGIAEDGTKVTVTFPDGTTATTTVGTDGKWTVPNPGLKDGDKVTAVATDPAGNTTVPTEVIVKDTIAPNAPDIDPINEANVKEPITGTGEPQATVTVTYPDGTTATTTVGTDGKWTVPNPCNLKNDDVITAIQTDPAGNPSLPATEKVDTLAPNAPDIDPINEANVKEPITGTGEPKATVTVTYPDGTTATTTVGTDGKWTVPNPGNLKNDDVITAIQTDPAGNPSLPATEKVDTLAPNAPDIDPINEANVKEPITGTGEPQATVTVTYPDGTTATTTVGTDGKWTVPNPGNLKNDDVITAIQTDPAGNPSLPATEKVDTLAPNAPDIDPINEANVKEPITGTGEPQATVTVTYPDGTTATTTVGTDGKWTVPNPGNLKNDDVITAIQTDPAGNPSLPATEKVDTLAPNAPDIDPINEANVKEPITGTGEPQATVTVTYPDGTTATTTVGTDGKWTVPNPGNLKNDDVITAIQTDPAGNPSLPATEKVDTLAPNAPDIDPINEANVKEPITGTGEPQATVTVTYPDGTTATTTVGTDGKWTVPNPGNLKNDDVITAIQTDPAGNPSLPATEKVDTLAPNAPDIDPINEANVKEPITGTGEPQATVTVTYPDGTTATTTVGTDGKWTVPNPGNLKNDDVITAIQTDPAGNPSLPATEKVDTLAPNAPDIDPINEANVKEPITGTGEPQATVTVTYPDGTTATTTVGTDGKWTVPNPGNLKNDDVITAIQTDPAGNPSLPATEKVDTLAPNAPDIDPINEANVKEPITGTGEPQATVTVTYPDGTTATTTVGTDGKWTVPNPGNLKNDDVITAIQTDPAGNPSLPATEKVDTLAPNAPDIDPINEANVKEPITGTGEPQATVTVTYPDGTTATTTVGTDGKWTVPNPGNLKNDDVITAIQTDPAGNPSLPATEKVDTLAPNAPDIDPINEANVKEPITGTGEPQATVTVTYPDGTTATTTVGTDGKWTVPNPGNLKNDDVITAIQTDPAGNPSLPATEKVDTLAPNAPDIDPINEANVKEPITGTGEPQATVTVTYPDGTTATTTVGTDGKWTVPNPGNLKNDDVITAIQTDPAGNPSLPATEKVDTLAPNAPDIDPINEANVKEPITGTGEPQATVTVTYPDGTTATTTVGTDGKWTVPNPGNLKNDDVISAIQTDPAGNPSLPATEKVDTLAPNAPDIDPINEANVKEPITGTGEPQATVTVTYPDGTTATTTVGTDGKWTVPNPGNLKNDDVITAIQTDPAGNPSLPATEKVDTLAPNAPDIDPINEANVKEPITGTGEPQATVTVTYPDGTTATTTVGTDGKWTVPNPGNLKNDDVITAIQTDPAGNPSLPATEKVDTLAPNAPDIDPINEANVKEPITGTGEPQATVTVTYPDGTTATTTVGTDGKWTVPNPGNLKNDDVISAIQTDPAGNPSLPATEKVDTLAPNAPDIDPINEANVKEPITGTGEPQATVTVTYPDGTTATTTVGTDGKWTVPNPGNLKNDDVITAIQTDPAGNPSLPATEKVDTLAPNAPDIDPINEANVKEPITGTGEPQATVTVTYPDGTTATTTVGTDGKWTVPNPGNLKNDDVISAIQTDPAGNPSLPATEKVDTLAPNAPDIDPINEANVKEPITGTGEPQATVTVTYPDGTTATTTVGTDGKWTVPNPGNLKNDDVITAIQTDPAGNPSLPATEKVDTLAPNAPDIDPINEANVKEPITGTGEPQATVTVTYPDGTTATTTVGTDGKWTVPNPGNLKNDDVISAIQTDPAGNPSLPATEKVDTLAPNAPDIDPINEANVKEPITGTGEPQATVTVTYPDGTTATTTVGTDGKWTVPNPGNLKNDDVISAIQTDPAGNPSLPATEKVDTLAPNAPDIDPINEANVKEPITGTGEPQATVTVTYPDGTTATTTVGTDGKWTVPNPGNLKNDDVITAIQTDPAGNPSLPATEKVDTLAPNAPDIDPINEANVKEPITGTGEPQATVTVTYPDGTTATTTVGTDGKWTVPNPGNLKNDDVITAIQTDPAGNPSLPGTEKVDTFVETPKLSLEQDTGVSATDSITNDGKVNVSGLEAGGTWKYSTDGGTTWTTGTGTSFTLPEGTYDAGKVLVQQTDAVGNISTNGQLPATTVDLTVATPGFTFLDTGVSATDNITYATKLTVTGIESGATWEYSLDGGNTWNVGSGTTFDAQSDTTYAAGQIQVRQTDTAGNISNVGSHTSSIEFDNSIQSVNLYLHEDTGLSNKDYVTSNGQIDLVNMPADIVSWEYSLTGLTGPWYTGTGTSFILPEGTYSQRDIAVQVVDVAGNKGAELLNAFGTVVVDKTITSPTLALSQDTGAVATDGITNDGTVNVTGLESGGTWKYSVDGGTTWQNGSGTSFILPVGAYASGKVLVQQTDLAGNISGNGQLPATTVDQTIATPTLALAQDTGSSATDGITNDGTVNVTGLEAGGTWKYSTDGGVTWQNGSGTSFTLPAGTYAAGKVQVQQTDVAGNVSTNAQLPAVTIDTTKPLVDINPIAGPGPITGTSDLIGGTVTVKFPDNTTATATVGADGKWTVPNPGGLTTGGNVDATVTDPAGNVGTTTEAVGNLSVATPSVALAQDTGTSATDGITKDGTVNVTGLEPGSTWTYSTDGGTTWTTGTGTSFTLPEGTYVAGKVLVKQTDSDGNISSNGQLPATTVDQTVTPPAVALAQDTGTSATDGITKDGTVNVTGLEAGSTWKYSTDGGATWQNGSGTSFTLPAGTYAAGKVQVQQTDAAGNISTSAQLPATTVDQAIATPALALAQDTGSSATDGITSNGSVNVTGLEAGSTWKYSTDGGATWQNGSGTSFTLPAGTYAAGKVQVQQTDVAGNVSTNAQLPATTVDQAIATPALALAQDTGSSATDGITSNGTVNVTGLEAGSTWKYSTDGGTTWQNGSGTSFTLPAGTYAAGKVQVQQTDVAGNVSTNAQLPATTVDQAIATPTLALAQDTGSSATDGITSNGAVNVTGLEAGSTWKYSTDGGTTWQNGSGTSFTLPAGTYAAGKVQVQQTDVAGNVSANAQLPATTVDTAVVAPTVALAQDTGSSATDGITKDGTVNVTGLEAGSTWKYSTDGGTTWQNGSGTSFTLPAGTYAAGKVQVQQTDVAGNVSTNGQLPATTVDQTIATPALALAQDTGSSATDGITNNGTVNVTGLEAGSTWKYSTDGGTTWQNGSSTSFTLPAGTYAAGKVQVQQTDVAGNISTNAQLPATTVDQAIATPTLALAQDTGSSATDGITNNGTVNVTSLEAGSTWKYSTDGGTTWQNGSGTNFTLPEGSYAAGKVLVQQTDIAGNVSTNAQLPATTVDKIALAPNFTFTDTGVSATDNLTYATKLTVTGLESGATWEYSLDGGKTWNVGSGTTFDAAPDTTYAADQIQVRQTDTAGNISAAGSKNVSIEFDNSIQSANLYLHQDTGVSSNDNITSNGQIDLVNFDVTDVTSWQYSLTGLSGPWYTGTGTSFILPEGTYNQRDIAVQVFDDAGNQGVEVMNASGTIVVDKTAAQLGLSFNDTGISNTDGITYDNNFTVSNLESGATWQYSLDSGSTWTTGTGTGFKAVADTIYAIGQIQVRQTDVAGNTSPVKSNTIRIDIDNSVFGPTLELKNDTGAGVQDSNTSDGTMLLNNMSPDNISWNYSLDGGKTWIAGDTSNQFVIPEGVYPQNQIQTQVFEASGYQSTDIYSGNLTVDKTAPQLAINPITSNTITGTSDLPGGQVQVTFGTSPDIVSATVQPNGNWTITKPSTAVAGDDVTVKLADIAGNQTTVVTSVPHVSTASNDTFNLTAGSDTVYMTLLNAADARGGNGTDVVKNFVVGNVGTVADADVIDIHELLSSYAGPKDASAISNGISNFLNVSYTGGNTVISVDRDGGGSTHSMTTLITLNNTNTTLLDLLNNHQIII